MVESGTLGFRLVRWNNNSKPRNRGRKIQNKNKLGVSNLTGWQDRGGQGKETFPNLIRGRRMVVAVRRHRSYCSPSDPLLPPLVHHLPLPIIHRRSPAPEGKPPIQWSPILALLDILLLHKIIVSGKGSHPRKKNSYLWKLFKSGLIPPFTQIKKLYMIFPRKVCVFIWPDLSAGGTKETYTHILSWHTHTHKLCHETYTHTLSWHTNKYRHTDTQTHRHTDTQTNSQRHIQTHTHTCWN